MSQDSVVASFSVTPCCHSPEWIDWSGGILPEVCGLNRGPGISAAVAAAIPSMLLAQSTSCKGLPRGAGRLPAQPPLTEATAYLLSGLEASETNMKVSIEALPAEVLVHVFTIKQDGVPVLGLRDWAKGEIVCRRWRDTLSGNLSSESLQLDSTCPLGVCQWLIKRQPRISFLTIIAWEGTQHVLPDILTACAKHCELLGYDAPDNMSLSKVFPQPHLISSRMRTLVSRNSVLWDAGWTASLAQLSQLQRLQLHVQPQARAEVAVLPSMGALTFLRVELGEGFGAFRLSSQPALQWLTLASDGSPLDLRTGPAAFPCLEKLCLSVDGGDVAVDFGGMAQLQAAILFVSGELEGAGTLTAATALQALSLKRLIFNDDSGDEEEQEGYNLERPWVLELLRCLPQSVRGLELEGRWSQEVSDTLAPMTQLQALGLLYCAEDDSLPASYPPAGAPLWGSLRALEWFHTYVDEELPEALKSATNLQLLQLRKTELSSDEEDMLLSFPALKCLHMPFCNSAVVWVEADETIVNQLQQCMRTGQTASADYLGGQHYTFLEAALPELRL